MTPEVFKYLDMVARLSMRMETRDVLYFDPKIESVPADIVVCVNQKIECLDTVYDLTNRIAMFFVEKDVPEWMSAIEERFKILYADPGFGYPVFFGEKRVKRHEFDLKQSEVAAYDMGNRPATFDIFQLLATAKTFGAKHVRLTTGTFKKKNYSIESAERRLESIIKPAIKLYGLDYSIGEPLGVTYSHLIDSTVRTFNHFGRISKIPYPIEDKGYVTITLRKSRTPGRDSNEEEWMKFAKTLDREVITVRDYDEQPLEIDDRMKLYAGAHMNFFVNNGPAILCILSEAPYCIVKFIGDENSGTASPEFTKSVGIVPGFQFPWKNAKQLLCYDPDTCENIQAAYSLMNGKLRIAA